MTQLPPCSGIGLLLGHKFQARYSLSQPMGMADVKGRDIPQILEATKAKPYHLDICVRCGLTVNQGGET